MPDHPAPVSGPTLRAGGFVAVARALAAEAAAVGAGPICFQTPPRTPGVDRALRRRRDGGATVLVRRQGRPDTRVVEDMVDGVLLAIGRCGRGLRVMPDRAALLAAAWCAVEGPAPRAARPLETRQCVDVRAA